MIIIIIFFQRVLVLCKSNFDLLLQNEKYNKGAFLWIKIVFASFFLFINFTKKKKQMRNYHARKFFCFLKHIFTFAIFFSSKNL